MARPLPLRTTSLELHDESTRAIVAAYIGHEVKVVRYALSQRSPDSQIRILTNLHVYLNHKVLFKHSGVHFPVLGHVRM